MTFEKTIEVIAPARLHFGLLALGIGVGRRFGGAGVMVEQPRLKLQLRPADRFESCGLLSDRTRAFAQRWREHYGLSGLPAVRLEVLESPRQHSGLGVGTQLGLSVATALNAWCQKDQVSPEELARSVGRAERSAVGTYGFVRGGMVVERGKRDDQRLSPLVKQIELPGPWRFVMICPRDVTGLSGTAEADALQNAPPGAENLTAKLVQELEEFLLPAGIAGDFSAFSESLFRYGLLAGKLCASQQGGPYHPRVTELVEWIRSLGIRGVGQSSWGPTVYALLPTQQEAARFLSKAQEHLGSAAADMWLSEINRGGARLRII